ncbi:MAG: hypothetical protein KGH91_03055 [Rhodospirillales bacterium]|nr:hypothetical protein [Rhodospirillales bacterium]
MTDVENIKFSTEEITTLKEIAANVTVGRKLWKFLYVLGKFVGAIAAIAAALATVWAIATGKPVR